MDTTALLHHRLFNQLLLTRSMKTPQDVVSWMGAMQSQVLDLAKWAIGSRLQHSSVKDVEQALNTGKVIRTHILRPTWHFVSADDIHWMFALSSERLKPMFRYYAKANRAEEVILNDSVPVLVDILEGGKHLTKQEIAAALLERDVLLDTLHLNHAISYAEMEGLLVNGRLKENKQTYTLLEEWVPRKESISKDEALERLARRFFTSHGPATLLDFHWWSGLSLTECRHAIQSIAHDFISEKANGREFWMKNDLQSPSVDIDSALLLAPFDEFVVSYKDRSEMIDEDHHRKVITKNGIFSPTIMVDGHVIGTWKKTTPKGAKTSQKSVEVALSFFEKTMEKEQSRFQSEIKRLENFYQK